MPAESLFLISAVAQYTGATIAVRLFDRVEPATVAWFRVIGATALMRKRDSAGIRGALCWSVRGGAGAAEVTD